MNRIEAARLKRPLLEAVIATIVLTFAVPCAQAQNYHSWNGGTGDWNSTNRLVYPRGLHTNESAARRSRVVISWHSRRLYPRSRSMWVLCPSYKPLPRFLQHAHDR